MAAGGWSEPTFRMTAVRVMEVAALALIASAVVEMWVAWDGPQFAGDVPGPELPFDQRAWMVVMSTFRGPMALLVVAVLLALALAVVHGFGPVAQAGVLRWEVGALLVASLLSELLALAAHTVAAFTTLPFGTPDEKWHHLAAGGAMPVAGSLLLALVALWWWRLRAEAGDLGAAAARGDGRERPGEPDEWPHGWTPAFEEDVARLDDLDGFGSLDGELARAERIDPVRRDDAITPRSADGSTSSGYDDYFRRS